VALRDIYRGIVPIMPIQLFGISLILAIAGWVRSGQKSTTQMQPPN
jgi:hypothetical protein